MSALVLSGPELLAGQTEQFEGAADLALTDTAFDLAADHDRLESNYEAVGMAALKRAGGMVSACRCTCCGAVLTLLVQAACAFENAERFDCLERSEWQHARALVGRARDWFRALGSRLDGWVQLRFKSEGRVA